MRLAAGGFSFSAQTTKPDGGQLLPLILQSTRRGIERYFQPLVSQTIEIRYAYFKISAELKTRKGGKNGESKNISWRRLQDSNLRPRKDCLAV